MWKEDDQWLETTISELKTTIRPRRLAVTTIGLITLVAVLNIGILLAGIAGILWLLRYFGVIGASVLMLSMSAPAPAQGCLPPRVPLVIGWSQAQPTTFTCWNRTYQVPVPIFEARGSIKAGESTTFVMLNYKHWHLHCGNRSTLDGYISYLWLSTTSTYFQLPAAMSMYPLAPWWYVDPATAVVMPFGLGRCSEWPYDFAALTIDWPRYAAGLTVYAQAEIRFHLNYFSTYGGSQISDALLVPIQ